MTKIFSISYKKKSNDSNGINLNKKNNNKKLVTKLKKEAIEPIESWTTHGIPNIARTRYKSIKIVWAILFLVALGFSIYFVINTVQEFLDYNVTTVVRSISVDELEYPVITVCNKNVISTQEGFDYFKSLLDDSDVSYEDYLNLLKNGTDGFNLFNYLITQLAPYGLFYQLDFEDRRNLTNPIENMFVQSFLNDEDVSDVTNFEWIFNPRYGNCYQLNTNSQFKAKLAQGKNSLRIYFFFYQIEEIDDFGFDKGLFVSFTSKNHNSFIELNNMVVLNSGYIHNFKIDKSVFNKYPKPYSDCDFEVDANGDYKYPSSKFSTKYYDQMNSVGYSYSQSLCFSFCRLDLLGRNCELRVSSIKAPNNDNFCPDYDMNVLNTSDYLREIYEKYFLNKDIEEQCAKMCPLECKTEQYNLFSTSSTYEAQYIVDPDNYMGISVEFNSLSYLNYEETPSISIYNLVSNVGGVIGLLLGI